MYSIALVASRFPGLAGHLNQQLHTLAHWKPQGFVHTAQLLMTMHSPRHSATRCHGVVSRWIRMPALIYGVHTATTLVPILGDILFGPNSGPHSLALAGIYIPYLIVPALLAWRMAACENPFPSRKSIKRKAK